MMLRKCRACHQEKQIVDFPKVPKCVGGHSWQCKSCIRARNVAKIDPAVLAARPLNQARALRAEGKKVCNGCKNTKLITEFHRGAAVRWGKYGIAARCKACASLSNQLYRKTHREQLEEYNKRYREREDVALHRCGTRRARNVNNPRHVMQITLRHGLNRKPTEFPASVDDLMAMFESQHGDCALSGLKMTWAKGRVTATSLSLDRINPNGGYSVDNIRLVCQAVNAFRGRMTDEEMLEIARAIIMKAENQKPTWKPYLVHSEAA